MIFCCFQLSYADAQRASSADSLRAFRHAAVTVPVARCGVSAPGAAATEETWKTSSPWKYRKLHPVAASAIGCTLSLTACATGCVLSRRLPLALSGFYKKTPYVLMMLSLRYIYSVFNSLAKVGHGFFMLWQNCHRLSTACGDHA